MTALLPNVAPRALQSAFRKSLFGSRTFHASSSLSSVMETERSNYPLKYDKPPEKKKESIFALMLNGYKIFKEQTKLFMQETKTAVLHDPYHEFKTPEPIILWKFDNNPETRYQWVVTCDSDYNEGYSNASLELSVDGTGIFSGNLSTRKPKDGKIKKSGYCNITTVRKYKSFFRKVTMDWSPCTHLVLRIRGDGRCYMLNILCRGYHDITWNDSYHYPIYTTGGPYWQIVKVPFSKFFFTSKGVIQDKQSCIALHSVTNFGITLGDKVQGPFKLEIDYIGLEYDPNHYEEFAYEMYRHTNLKQ